MDQEELNIALYNKLTAEQDDYRDWLLCQPPEEILSHSYEYSVREDIVCAMEFQDLPCEQAEALLACEKPLASIYNDFIQIEGDHMDIIRGCIRTKAEDLMEEQAAHLRSIPVYASSAAYAVAHNELEQYRESFQANIECKNAIEEAVARHYHDNRLDISCVKEVLDRFGPGRTSLIIANTILKHKNDGRISPENHSWAAGVTTPCRCIFSDDRQSSVYAAVHVHSGLLNLFADQVRKEVSAERKPSVLNRLHQERSVSGIVPRKKEAQR